MLQNFKDKMICSDVPVGETMSLTNCSCSGFLRRMSAAIGSGLCMLWMSPGIECDLNLLARDLSVGDLVSTFTSAVGDRILVAGSSSYK